MSTRPDTRAVSAPLPPVLSLTGSVLLTGPALTDAYYLVAAGIRYTRHNGHPIPARFETLLTVIGEQRAKSQPGQCDTLTPAPRQHCETEELIGSQQAADILGVSKRQTQRLAADLDGRLAGGHWVFDKKAVEAYAAQRNTK